MLHLSAGKFEDIAKILGSLGVIFAAVRYIYRRLKRTAMILNTVIAEFSNNGGSTMRDAVDRIEKAVSCTETHVQFVQAAVTVLEQRFDEQDKLSKERYASAIKDRKETFERLDQLSIINTGETPIVPPITD
jgi:hypothetical protein